MAGARVTMATVAARLGISVATVSNAYNRPEKLSTQLRARIMTVADELGYGAPDPVARSLRRRRTGGIGLVFSDELSFAFSDPASAGFLAGVSESLSEADLHLVLLPVGTPDRRRRAPVDRVAVDGLVLHSMPTGNETIALMQRRGTPSVIVDQPRPVEGLGWVGLDESAGMREVGVHLRQLGHTRVGAITSRLGTRPYDGAANRARLRRSRYAIPRQRLTGLESGLRASVVVEERWNVSEFDGMRAAAALMRRDRRITAIVCIADIYAIGVLDWAREHSIGVPHQLTVVGHDDVARAGRAQLTTVRQPFDVKGRVAAQMLLSLIDGGSPTHQLLSTELIVRATSGPAMLRD